MADLQAILEVQLAKALRAVDMASMVAEALQNQIPKTKSRAGEIRALETVRRVQAVRQAITAAGICLPPLRAIWQTAERFGLGGDKEDPQP
jgi:hypothetical protein